MQARSQHFYKGGTRRSAEGMGSGEGPRSPSTVWGSGGVAPQKILENQRQTNTLRYTVIPLVLAASGV